MFCLTVPKEIVQESFSVSLIRVSKILGIRGVGHDILSKTFVSQFRKKLERNLLGFHLILGIEKICALEGYIMIFCRKFSVSQSRETSYRNPSVFH